MFIAMSRAGIDRRKPDDEPFLDPGPLLHRKKLNTDII